MNPTPNKIYISGPMSGVILNNLHAFENAAIELRDKGFQVINPHELNVAVGSTHMQYMRKDFVAMASECILMLCLPGYKKSKGTMMEIEFCKLIGMPWFEIEHVINDPTYIAHIIEKAKNELTNNTT